MTTLLIVDDERTTRLALSEAFNQMGYQAVMAANGDEALAILSVQEFDVAVLDLRMPGTTGIQVLDVAQTLAPETAFIILTAYASAETAISALRLRAFDYLLKPASLDAIAEVVERAVSEQQQQRQQSQGLYLLEQAMNYLQTPLPSTPSLSQRQRWLENAGISLNPDQQQVLFHNQPIDLTPVEYKLLRIFMQQPNLILAYTDLARASHDLTLPEEDARLLLRTHLYRLRRKLEQYDKSPLQNIRGRGYILRSKPADD